MLFAAFALLADSAAPKGNQGSATPMLIALALFFGVFYFVLMRGNRKQQRERKALIDNLSKNDRVLTIGGILGTVTAVKDHEVTVKVDESNNTKMTFLKTAIQKVVTESDPVASDSRS
jgi:preprotein translocase subunit YajC